jgi:hypothetical protein
MEKPVKGIKKPVQITRCKGRIKWYTKTLLGSANKK